MALVVVSEDFYDSSVGHLYAGEVIDTTLYPLPESVQTVPYVPAEESLPVLEGALVGRGVAPSTIVSSGEFVPILTAGLNTTSPVLRYASYQRIRSTVSVQMTVTITSSTPGASNFRTSLPIDSALASVDDLSGQGVDEIQEEVLWVEADVGNEEALIVFSMKAGVHQLRFAFSYRLL